MKANTEDTIEDNVVMCYDTPDSRYNYVHKPKHYSLFSPEDIKVLAARGEGIDVVAIANKAGLDKDAYMFNVLKYVLRQQKPNEPRSRDVEKIREYAGIWLSHNGVEQC